MLVSPSTPCVTLEPMIAMGNGFVAAGDHLCSIGENFPKLLAVLIGKRLNRAGVLGLRRVIGKTLGR